MAGAGDLRIGIGYRRHHARDAGLDDGVGTRWGLAVMRARLERDVEVQPRPTITGPAPSSRTTKAPTAGFGQVRPRPRRPSASAKAMKRKSSEPGSSEGAVISRLVN
jgi:hypothetical protein